ncbi:hypothetical protein E0K83_17155 [Gramella sp. BOM4]|nr:hypothetical protein [Christiangramia bathymodioli]
MVSSTKITRDSIIKDLQGSARKQYPASQDLNPRNSSFSRTVKRTRSFVKESLSILTTSGVTAISVFGLEISLFNGLLLGLIITLLVVGFLKPIYLTLSALGAMFLVVFSANKIVEYSLYFIEQVILFFQLRDEAFMKNSISAIIDGYLGLI